MPQILPIDSLNTTPSEGVVLSPAVSNILSQTHEGADKIIRLHKFAEEETSLITWVSRSVLGTLKSSSVKPEDMSNIVQMNKEYRQFKEAA